MLNCAAAIDILRANERDLRARGVVRVAVFGSVARNEARKNSNVDILIEIDPRARISIYQYVGLKRIIAGLFPGKADVVEAKALKPGISDTARRDAVYAF